MASLHITNGDSAAEGLRRAQLVGDVLPWRDVLHDGPVPATASWSDFAAVRARFLSSRGAGTFEELAQSFADRDNVLESVGGSDDVTLWFEPDLYDQLQLCEVLARLADRDAKSCPQLYIVPADCLLGPLDAAEFAPLYAGRRPLTSDHVALGASAWKEITCPDPASIAAAVARASEEQQGGTYSANETSTLPHLAAALIRWLEQLPSFVNGLNRTEQHICDVLSGGPLTLADTYKRSHHDVEEWTWLGDWGFAWYVQQLGDGKTPVVVQNNGAPFLAANNELSASTFREVQIRLTDFGNDVQQLRADVIDANGIDRWFGGAHLVTADHWRWDSPTRLVVSRRSGRHRRPRE